MSSIFYMCRKGKKGGFVKSSLFLGGGLLELIRKVEKQSVFKGPSDFFCRKFVPIVGSSFVSHTNARFCFPLRFRIFQCRFLFLSGRGRDILDFFCCNSCLYILSYQGKKYTCVSSCTNIYVSKKYERVAQVYNLP